jgi:crotonobetainyl-CoA:carnitine CoA-transferase CaiB-like acyl-CoA transferase
MGPFFKDEPHPEKSGLFLYLNTNKRSVTLNLETQTGVDILKELVRDTNVLVENFEPRIMPGLGLSYETLEEINHSLVMVSITPFGQTGLYRDFKATELTAFAMGGVMSLTGEPDREPLKSGGSQAQYQGGLHAFSAATVVAFGAMMNGLGQHVDISLMECSWASILAVMATLVSMPIPVNGLWLPRVLACLSLLTSIRLAGLFGSTGTK